MAALPCHVGPHRHSGRNVNVYVGFIGDGDPERYSTRLCDLHWGEVEPHLAKYEVLIEDPTSTAWGDVSWCASCGQPLDERGRQLFITAYPAKNERKDYWLHVHYGCSVPRFTPKNPGLAGA